jgi:hypothetical protein
VPPKPSKPSKPKQKKSRVETLPNKTPKEEIKNNERLKKKKTAKTE